MQSFLRTSLRVPRRRLFAPAGFTSVSARTYAQEAYGNDMSGHQQSDAKNPKEHLEHPGPEAPASQGTAKSSSSESQPSGDTSSTSGKAQPKISTPKSVAEDSDPEVKKHNEEMKNRSEKSANQLSESDNAVDKKFWKGA